MLVSVVVLTYNSAAFVLETLESIAAQTYPELELIVSDDCSKDNTVEICRDWIVRYQDRFSRTELLTVEKNTGISNNCNRGYAAASGQWIKGIAGDDILRCDCIERCVQAAEENPENIFLGYLQEFGAGNQICKPKPRFEKVDAKQQLNMVLADGLYVAAPSCFCKKSLWAKLGGFDEKYPLFEDLPFYVRVLQSGERIGIIAQITVNYRIHNNSASRHFDTYSRDRRKWCREILIPLQWKYHHYIAWWHTTLTLWRTDSARPQWIQKYPCYALWLLLDFVALKERIAYQWKKQKKKC